MFVKHVGMFLDHFGRHIGRKVGLELAPISDFSSVRKHVGPQYRGIILKGLLLYMYWQEVAKHSHTHTSMG